MSASCTLPSQTQLKLRLEGLLQQGAIHSYASRCRYIEGLLSRCDTRSEAVALRLRAAADNALRQLQRQFESHRQNLLKTLEQTALSGEQNSHCKQLIAQGRFAAATSALQGYATSPAEISPLATLLAELLPGFSTQQSQESQLSLPLAPTLELPSVGEFRQLWVTIHSERRVELAVEEGPEDAGPLNQDKLAIRSLTAMQQLSPAYLTRYLSYVDTLLWLQQAEQDSKKSGKSATL